MRPGFIIAGLFIICGPHNSSAQVNDLVFRHLTRSNGLPVSIVNCLAQDSAGFIWIGSNEGLYRYDGFSFKSFYVNPQKKNTIPANWIIKIYVTKKGLIWITTFGGGAALLNQDGRVLKVINSSTCSLFSENSNLVNDVKEDKVNNTWLSSADGLFRVSADGARIERFDPGSIGEQSNIIRDFILDADDNLWLGTGTGLRIFDTKKLSFRTGAGTSVCCEELKRSGFLVHTLIFHHKDLWYSSWLPDLGYHDTAGNANTIIYSGKKIQRPDHKKMANFFYVDSKDALWIATSDGLHLKRIGEAKISNSYYHDARDPNSLVNDIVNAVLEDRDGNFWFGTEAGISIARPYGQWLKTMSVNNLQYFPFGNKTVSDIIEIDSNRLLVGTYLGDGLYLTDRDFKIKKHFSFRTRYDWIWTHYIDKPRNRIFISTQEGMLLYDIKRNDLKIESRGVFKNRYPVSSFLPMSDSVIWFSRFTNNITRLNLNTGSYKEYDVSSFGIENLPLLTEKDKDNNIWLVPSGAAPLQFDEHTGKMVQRLERNDSAQSLRKNGIYFFKDLGEYFIIGYQVQGLTLYHKKTRYFEHYSKADGLPSDAMKDAVVAKDGTLWIASRNGIIHFDPRFKKFKSYGFEDGILENYFEYITQLSDGRIVAGSRRGIIAFHPGDIEKSQKQPSSPVFSNISVYGHDVPMDSLLPRSKPLYIPHKQNYFSIEFISLQYNSSRKLEYAFLLEGLDKDWTFAGERRSVTYSKIKGGSYNFRVRVREPGGDWVEAKQSLPVLIQTPFYQQWWFYLLCTALLAAIVYAIFRYRLQQLLKIEKMRTVISGDLHDEIGSSLTSISIFSQMAMKNLSTDSKEEEYLQRIGARSRESIDKMSDIVWTINPDNDSLEQIVVRMKNYSSEISEAKDILVHWNESGKLSHVRMTMEQRKNFYLLFKEVINNAIKHSRAKNIFISLIARSSEIQLRIKDDGIGFAMGDIHAGNGLKNIKRRADTLNGNLEISSLPGTGTDITLKFSVS